MARAGEPTVARDAAYSFDPDLELLRSKWGAVSHDAIATVRPGVVHFVYRRAPARSPFERNDPRSVALIRGYQFSSLRPAEIRLAPPPRDWSEPTSAIAALSMFWVSRLGIAGQGCEGFPDANHSRHTALRRFVVLSAGVDAHDLHARLKAREAPQPRFCWHCRKPLHARSDRCPFCGEAQ